MKNPWMSAWLSAANAWSGAARGVAAAEAKRARTAAFERMSREAMAFWFPFAPPPPKPAFARKRRRKG